MKLGVQVKAQIGEEQSELWKEYQEKAQGLGKPAVPDGI